MFLRKLFYKNKENANISTTMKVATDYMKVINAAEIDEMRMPAFNQSHWGSEEDYKLYLESVQSLIEEYEQTGAIHTLEYNSLDDIEKNREEQHKLNQFNSSFLSVGHYINVEKTLTGKYKVVSNGRHRMYVAKKFGFKLLVHVAQEVVELNN